MKNRSKGSVLDLFYILAVVLVFGIMIVISAYLADQIMPQLITFFGTGTTATTVLNTAKQGFGTLDYIFLFVYFIISLAPIMFAFLVKTHPIFYVVNLIMLVIYMLIVPTISNVMREVWMTEGLATYASGGGAEYTFPIMTAIFQYLPLLSFGISFILMIATFAKGDAGGGM